MQSMTSALHDDYIQLKFLYWNREKNEKQIDLRAVIWSDKYFGMV